MKVQNPVIDKNFPRRLLLKSAATSLPLPRAPNNSKHFKRKMSGQIMISACLLGIQCRYDGWHSFCPGLAEFATTTPIIPFCPEQLGGLPTPRSPASMIGGDGRDVLSGKAKVVNAMGANVTEAFKKGADESLKLARLTGTTIAVMKNKSPSCGLAIPYCEKPSDVGLGVTAALFQSNHIKVFELGSSDIFPTPDFFELMECTDP